MQENPRKTSGKTACIEKFCFLRHSRTLQDARDWNCGKTKEFPSFDGKTRYAYYLSII
tara:strand:+ start:348 stop:521 length:174 start_codon:yes stop_codon:yes gene_type:complete